MNNVILTIKNILKDNRRKIQQMLAEISLVANNRDQV